MLAKTGWTHAAHFTATIWLLKCRPELDLPTALPDIIRAYNEATGGTNSDTTGYHETITQASIRAARAFVAARPNASLVMLANELMASPLGKKDWILAHWSRSRLFSVEARRIWVEPDIGSLPF